MKPIFFKDQGKGFPLVLLHGFCETHQIWDGLVNELANDFRVIRPDLPGFGKSQLPAQPFTLDDVGGLLRDWLLGLRIKRPVIIGHSLGGYLALAIAQKDINLPAGLGLFHSTPFADSDEKKGNRNKTIDFVKRFGVAPFVETFIPGLFHQKENPAIDFVRKTALTTSLATLISYSEAMRDRPSREDLLKNYQGQVLVVAGMYDSVIPFSVLQQINVRAPETIFCPLEETGHMGMFENRPGSLDCFRKLALRCKQIG